MEKPYQGRATIVDHFNGIEIKIPSKKNWFVILFICFWLCGWFVGESSTIITLTTGNSSGPDGFLLFWVCGWTVGGFFALRIFIWSIFGNEVIVAEMGTMTIDRKGALFFKAKTYDLKDAQNFRVIEDDSGPGQFGNRRTGLLNPGNSGTIRFDYGMKTIKFGDGIDEAEAFFILQKLKEKKLIN